MTSLAAASSRARASGRIQAASVQIVAGRRRLHAYVGLPLFGKDQVWRRTR